MGCCYTEMAELEEGAGNNPAAIKYWVKGVERNQNIPLVIGEDWGLLRDGKSGSPCFEQVTARFTHYAMYRPPCRTLP